MIVVRFPVLPVRGHRGHEDVGSLKRGFTGSARNPEAASRGALAGPRSEELVLAGAVTNHQPSFPDVREAFMTLIRGQGEFRARKQPDLIQQAQSPEPSPKGMRGVALVEGHPDFLGFGPDVPTLD
jgi:hypothetical protein